MKVHPQIITQHGNPAFVVLPYAEYEEILNQLEDIADFEAIELSAQDKSENFPLDMVERIASGENAIKVFREYRGLNQMELAHKLNVSRQYISQIESGERKGTIQLLKKIARQLHVDLDDIV